MRDFPFCEPSTIQDALELIDQFGPEVKILAGGTDLIMDIQHRRQKPGPIVSINAIADLGCIQVAKDGLHIGAAVPFSTLASSPLVTSWCQMLTEGAASIGSVQIRNVATMGGNVCNALPCADTLAPLAAASAVVVLVSKNGSRTMPVEEFVTGPRKTALNSGELLVEFILPPKPARTGSAYLMHTTRRALDLTIAGVAVSLTLDPIEDIIREACIAPANSSPRPMRAGAAEKVLLGNALTDDLAKEAGELLAQAARVRDSALRATAEYRRDMLKVLTQRALTIAHERAFSANPKLN